MFYLDLNIYCSVLWVLLSEPQYRNTRVTQKSDLVSVLKVVNWGSTKFSTSIANFFFFFFLHYTTSKIKLQSITLGLFSHGTFLFLRGQMINWVQLHYAHFITLASKQILSRWKIQCSIEVLNISSLPSRCLYYIILCTQPFSETWRAERLKSRRKGQSR